MYLPRRLTPLPPPVVTSPALLQILIKRSIWLACFHHLHPLDRSAKRVGRIVGLCVSELLSVGGLYTSYCFIAVCCNPINREPSSIILLNTNLRFNILPQTITTQASVAINLCLPLPRRLKARSLCAGFAQNLHLVSSSVRVKVAGSLSRAGKFLSELNSSS